MNPNFEGVYAVAITPFCKDGSFDIGAAKKHLDWLIESGVHGICVLGATGEYVSITNEEHKAYVREIVPYIKDRVPTVIGASRERPDDVVDLVQNAKECGARAAMVLPPFYCHPAQNEIVEHYRYIMERVDLPLIIYNNPGSAGVDIAPETFDEILKLKNAKVVKESTGDVKRLTDVLLRAPGTTSVFCGCDNMAYESFASGAHGWISMLANIAPRDCAGLYEAVAREKDFPKGWEIYKRLLPALNLLENFPKPVQALKHVLTTQRGLEGGWVRRPRRELSAEEKAYVTASMGADGIR